MLNKVARNSLVSVRLSLHPLTLESHAVNTSTLQFPCAFFQKPGKKASGSLPLHPSKSALGPLRIDYLCLLKNLGRTFIERVCEVYYQEC